MRLLFAIRGLRKRTFIGIPGNIQDLSSRTVYRVCCNEPEGPKALLGCECEDRSLLQHLVCARLKFDWRFKDIKRSDPFMKHFDINKLGQMTLFGLEQHKKLQVKL